MRKFRGLFTIALLSVAIVVLMAPAANADCIEATVKYEILNQGEETLHDGCVVPTPINNQFGQVGPLGVGNRAVVFVYFGVWFPLP